MKSIFRKSLCLLMILSFVLFGFSFLKVNADTNDGLTLATCCDFTTKTSGYSGYNSAWIYNTDWNVVNAANNNKGWTYIKLGGKSATLSSANPCYVNNKTKIDNEIVKITVSIFAGSLSKTGMAVNSWGVYAYSDKDMTNQIDYVAGGTITSAAATFDFVPSPTKTWPKGTYFKISFDLANTTTTNGIVFLDKISFYKTSEAVINFDGNEGTGTNPDDIKVTPGSNSSALPECPYTKTGFNFKEWNTNAEGTGTSYAPGTIITNVTTDITLYAIWELDSANNVIVTFNSNTGTNSTTSTQGVEINTPTALNSNTFTNNSMAFTGWNTEPNGTGIAYADGTSVTLSSALTLYAQWSAYSIASVIANGVENQTYFVQGEITAITKTTEAYLQDSTGAILIYDYASITLNTNYVTGNTVSFVATLGSYNSLPQLKSLTDITVINNDTTVNIAPITSASDITVANNRKYIELNEVKLNTVSSKTATIAGADYSIYYDGADYVDGEEYLLAGNYVNIKGVISTTATTKKICVTSVTSCTQYSLVFNMDGGKAINPQYVLAGNKFTAPTTTPTKDDDATYTYEFAGWYADSTYNTLFDFNQVYTEDKVAYAKWTATEFSAIQQNLNTINAYMSLAYTYDFTSQATYKYVKVTDISMLKAGDKVLFTCDAQKAYCTGFNSTYLTTAKYTGTPEYTNEYVFTLGGTEGAWTFTSTDGTLGATSDYKLNVSGNETTTWTISISSGVATIGSTAGGEMKYNSTSPRFKTYASGQQSINLYKQVADKVINSSDFRIRCGIDKAISSVVSSYAGAVYGIEVSDGTNTRKYASTNSLYNTDDENCDYVIIDLGDCLTNTTRLTQTFTVRAYVTYDSTTYYSTETKTFSVLGLLNTYYNNDATKALVKDLRVLLIEMGIIE